MFYIALSVFLFLLLFTFFDHLFLFTLGWLSPFYFISFSFVYFYVAEYIYRDILIDNIKKRILNLEYFSFKSRCSSDEEIESFLQDNNSNYFMFYSSQSIKRDDGFKKIDIKKEFEEKEKEIFLDYAERVWVTLAFSKFNLQSVKNSFSYLSYNFLALFFIMLLYVIFSFKFIDYYFKCDLFSSYLVFIYISMYAFIFLYTNKIVHFAKDTMILQPKVFKEAQLKLRDIDIKVFAKNSKYDTVKKIEIYAIAIALAKYLEMSKENIVNKYIDFVTAVFLVSFLTTVFFRLPQ